MDSGDYAKEKIYLFIYRIFEEKELIFIYFFKLKEKYKNENLCWQASGRINRI